jgi:Fur family ferric uptake transcriptional regulator
MHTQDILERLRQHGERLTVPRRLVIEILCERPGHLSVQDIQQHLRERQVDLNEATVYRILQWLKDLGMVSQTDLGQSELVYQLLGDQPHHHLVCLSCGAIIDIDDTVMTSLREQLTRDYGFEPRIDHMAIYGLCKNCRAR